jgi:hypothetical protein
LCQGICYKPQPCVGDPSRVRASGPASARRPVQRDRKDAGSLTQRGEFIDEQWPGHRDDRLSLPAEWIWARPHIPTVPTGPGSNFVEDWSQSLPGGEVESTLAWSGRLAPGQRANDTLSNGIPHPWGEDGGLGGDQGPLRASGEPAAQASIGEWTSGEKE